MSPIPFALALSLALAAPVPTAEPDVNIRALCKDGRLLALLITTTGPGQWTVAFPAEHPCAAPAQPTRTL